MPILATLLLVIGLAACGGGGGPSDLDIGGTPTTIVLPTTAKAQVSPAPATPVTVVPPYASLVATARTAAAKLSIYDAPDASAATRVLSGPVPVTGASPVEVGQVFRVESQRSDGWVQVQLPFPKPKGSSGWVRDTDVTITQVVYRMRVALGARRLTVFGRGRAIYNGPIAVDPSVGSTPVGHYFMRGFFTAPKSRTTDSPFVYGLIMKLSTLIPLGAPVDVVR